MLQVGHNWCRRLTRPMRLAACASFESAVESLRQQADTRALCTLLWKTRPQNHFTGSKFSEHITVRISCPASSE